MVRKPLFIVYALVAAALVACSPPSLEEQVRAQGIAPAAVVRLAEILAVAARDDGGRVRVIEFRMDDDERWVTQEIAAADDGGGPSSAQLFSSGGETGEAWNSFFYGTAPPSVSRVTVDGLQAEGGQVVEGAWVVALREKDVAPDQVRWEFLDAFGGVIDSGTGIFPPSR